MWRAVAVLGLAFMAVGLTLTALGTQGTFLASPVYRQDCTAPSSYCIVVSANGSVSGGVISCATATPPNGFGSFCGRYALPIGFVQTFPNFDLNYGGMFLAVLGSVFFAVFYPKKPSSSLPVNAAHSQSETSN
jgi:hypothetical protein